MDYDDALGHMAMLLAEYRERALEADAHLHNLQHELEQRDAESLYLRRVIAHIEGIDIPKRGEIDPNFGEWSMEALGIPRKIEDPDSEASEAGSVLISGPAIYGEKH